MFNFLKSSGPRVQPIAPADAIARAARGELTLIDVRDISELKSSGKAAGALHVPLATVQTRLNPKAGELPAGLAPDRPVCLYCAAGGRSAMAAEALLGFGYAEVYNLGGFGAWVSGGGQVERI